jgi:uncharacterized protein (DUF1786 family)
MKNQVIQYKSQWTIAIWNKHYHAYYVAGTVMGGAGGTCETAVSNIIGRADDVYKTKKAALEALELINQ